MRKLSAFAPIAARRSAHRRLRAVLCMALGLLAQPASAVTITFDALETPGSSFSILSNPLDLGDYRFTAINGSGNPATLQQSSSFYNGSAALTGTNSTDISMTRIDGGAFGVSSIDLDSLFGGGGTFEITGQLSGGGSVQELFVADGVLGNETAVLTGFQDITSLTLGAQGVPNLANVGSFDNVVVAPEPSSFALLLLGVGLTGAARRRRALGRPAP